MGESVFTKLEGIVGEGNVVADEPMSAHTTFEIGGPADYFVRPTTIDEVRAVVELCRATATPLHVLGLGSDLLVADAGVRGVVMQIADNLADIEIDAEYAVAGVGAGASNADVAEALAAAGLAGYEFASGIPGSIGGAAIMNAGAYDGQFSDAAIEVMCLDADLDFVRILAAEANWGYRQSRMNDEGMVVLGAVLQLASDDEAAIRARMADLAERRASKQPLEMPSAGSTFKRPEGHFAGKLIQDAGLQGYAVGGAQVSTKHAGFVVNAGSATAADVRQLIADVQARVLERDGVALEPEVRMWGFDD